MIDVGKAEVRQRHRSLAHDRPRMSAQPAAMSGARMLSSTARVVNQFTNEPVDDATLESCLQSATWAPTDDSARCWRFIVVRSRRQRSAVAAAAARALGVLEPLLGIDRPSPDDNSARAAAHRAIYELHDRAGEFSSVLLARQCSTATDAVQQHDSTLRAMRNFLLSARALGLGVAPTSWAEYGRESLLRADLGICNDWTLAGHVLIGWPG